MALGLACAVLAGECAPALWGARPARAEAAALGEGGYSGEVSDPGGISDPQETAEPGETPIPEETPAPTASAGPGGTQAPAVTSEPEPTVQPPATTPEQTATPKPTPDPGKYTLLNPRAKYKKGSLTGIHYHRVKGKKVYRITAYATDPVKLEMSQPSRFEVYGGRNKKEVKKKYATVSSKGVVTCHRRGKGETLYTLIRATSRTTGQVQYIYIYFKKKLTCSSRKLSLYEKYSTHLRIDYPRSKVTFSIDDGKKAAVNKKGKVTAIKKGTAYVTIKVKDSEKNQVRVKITVKKEPWIVSDKDKLYDYEDMTRDLGRLERKYAGKVKLMDIGTSYDKRTIWCLRVGNPGASHKLVIDAAIHAREWLNTQLIMRQTEDMLRDHRELKKRMKNTCLYILPMDNPDGVTISQYGFKAIRNKKLRKICKKAGHAKIWKANARGVNLNNNFPAGFEKSKKRKPHYMLYNGKKAGSERESKALMKFIGQIEPDAVLNLHSTGSVLYWDFDVEGQLHDKQQELAEKIRSFNSYLMMPKGRSTEGNGGFADWVVYKKKTVSITVETGVTPCPLPHSEYKSIYKRNRDMFRWFMTEY